MALTTCMPPAGNMLLSLWYLTMASATPRMLATVRPRRAASKAYMPADMAMPAMIEMNTRTIISSTIENPASPRRAAACLRGTGVVSIPGVVMAIPPSCTTVAPRWSNRRSRAATRRVSAPLVSGAARSARGGRVRRLQHPDRLLVLDRRGAGDPATQRSGDLVFPFRHELGLIEALRIDARDAMLRVQLKIPD